MAEQITVDGLVSWLRRFAELVHENAAMLTELDAATGDADHGANLDRGMRAVVGVLDSTEFDSADALLKKTGMSLKDIDLYEVNEAFAPVPMAWLKDLKEEGASWDKLNVNGGAIALGHPIGATGAMLVGTILDELERTGKRYGLVTLCTGHGMAPAVIIEKL